MTVKIRKKRVDILMNTSKIRDYITNNPSYKIKDIARDLNLSTKTVSKYLNLILNEK